MTAYRLAKKGKIPVLKIGGQWRMREETLEKYLDDGCKGNIYLKDAEVTSYVAGK